MNDDCSGSGDHRQQGTYRRASGHSEDERVGEGVAKECLQEHAGQCEQTAHAKPGEQPWQPDFEHDGPGSLISPAAQSLQRTAKTDAGAANGERRDGNRGGEDEQHGEAPPGCRREYRVMRGQAP